MVLPALIAGAFSLANGAANRNAQREANDANRPVNQVAEWEAAGINPLFGISSGGYIPHQATSIGDSFATAGAQFADFIAGDKEQELRETQLELENEVLKKELDGLVKPQEPGHLEAYVADFGVFPTADGDPVQSTDTSDGGSGGSGGLSVPRVAVADRPTVLAVTTGLEPGRATVTADADAGVGTYQNPRVVDAEMTEARSGDVMQNLKGFSNEYKDYQYNRKLQRLVRQHGRGFANQVHLEYSKADGRNLDQIIFQLRKAQPGFGSNPYDQPIDDHSGSKQMIIPSPIAIETEWLPTRID